MSAKDLISPYLNRFVVLLHQHSTAKVELSCENGKMSVNLFHDLGVVEDATPEPVPNPREPLYANVLKKNLKQSQFSRLQKRANARAEEARAETKVQQEIAANARIECDKATRDAEKAREEAENAKSLALKEKMEAQKVIDNSKSVAEQAHIKFIKAREKAEKAKALAKVEAEKGKNINQKEAVQAKPVINPNFFKVLF